MPKQWNDIRKLQIWENRIGQAAETGNLGAMNTLGYFYEKGICVEQNSEKAQEWYGKAVAK